MFLYNEKYKYMEYEPAIDNTSSRFSRYSEAFASEILENLEVLFAVCC